MINRNMMWATTLLLVCSLVHFAAADSSELASIDWSKCTGAYDENARKLTMTCPGFFNIKTISIESDV